MVMKTKRRKSRMAMRSIFKRMENPGEGKKPDVEDVVSPPLSPVTPVTPVAPKSSAAKERKKPTLMLNDDGFELAFEDDFYTVCSEGRGLASSRSGMSPKKRDSFDGISTGSFRCESVSKKAVVSPTNQNEIEMKLPQLSRSTSVASSPRMKQPIAESVKESSFLTRARGMMRVGSLTPRNNQASRSKKLVVDTNQHDSDIPNDAAKAKSSPVRAPRSGGKKETSDSGIKVVIYDNKDTAKRKVAVTLLDSNKTVQLEGENIEPFLSVILREALTLSQNIHIENGNIADFVDEASLPSAKSATNKVSFVKKNGVITKKEIIGTPLVSPEESKASPDAGRKLRTPAGEEKSNHIPRPQVSDKKPKDQSPTESAGSSTPLIVNSKEPNDKGNMQELSSPQANSEVEAELVRKNSVSSSSKAKRRKNETVQEIDTMEAKGEGTNEKSLASPRTPQEEKSVKPNTPSTPSEKRVEDKNRTPVPSNQKPSPRSQSKKIAAKTENGKNELKTLPPRASTPEGHKSAKTAPAVTPYARTKIYSPRTGRNKSDHGARASPFISGGPPKLERSTTHSTALVSGGPPKLERPTTPSSSIVRSQSYSEQNSTPVPWFLNSVKQPTPQLSQKYEASARFDFDLASSDVCDGLIQETSAGNTKEPEHVKVESSSASLNPVISAIQTGSLLAKQLGLSTSTAKTTKSTNLEIPSGEISQDQDREKRTYDINEEDPNESDIRITVGQSFIEQLGLPKIEAISPSIKPPTSSAAAEISLESTPSEAVGGASQGKSSTKISVLESGRRFARRFSLSPTRSRAGDDSSVMSGVSLTSTETPLKQEMTVDVTDKGLPNKMDGLTVDNSGARKESVAPFQMPSSVEASPDPGLSTDANTKALAAIQTGMLLAEQLGLLKHFGAEEKDAALLTLQNMFGSKASAASSVSKIATNPTTPAAHQKSIDITEFHQSADTHRPSVTHSPTILAKQLHDASIDPGTPSSVADLRKYFEKDQNEVCKNAPSREKVSQRPKLLGTDDILEDLEKTVSEALNSPSGTVVSAAAKIKQVIQNQDSKIDKAISGSAENIKRIPRSADERDFEEAFERELTYDEDSVHSATINRMDEMSEFVDKKSGNQEVIVNDSSTKNKPFEKSKLVDEKAENQEVVVRDSSSETETIPPVVETVCSTASQTSYSDDNNRREAGSARNDTKGQKASRNPAKMALGAPIRNIARGFGLRRKQTQLRVKPVEKAKEVVQNMILNTLDPVSSSDSSGSNSAGSRTANSSFRSSGGSSNSSSYLGSDSIPEDDTYWEESTYAHDDSTLETPTMIDVLTWVHSKLEHQEHSVVLSFSQSLDSGTFDSCTIASDELNDDKGDNGYKQTRNSRRKPCLQNRQTFNIANPSIQSIPSEENGFQQYRGKTSPLMEAFVFYIENTLETMNKVRNHKKRLFDQNKKMRGGLVSKPKHCTRPIVTMNGQGLIPPERRLTSPTTNPHSNLGVEVEYAADDTEKIDFANLVQTPTDDFTRSLFGMMTTTLSEEMGDFVPSKVMRKGVRYSKNSKSKRK